MILKIILLLTSLSTALITGFFYAYVCSVNPGLSKLPDLEYLKSMQSINRAVLNPVFFASFFGALIMLPLSSFLLHREEGASVNFFLALSATIVYAAGVFLVTGMGNVPLNETLAKVNLPALSPDELHQRRIAFEQPWNKFNMIRTMACVVSLALILSVSWR